MVYACVPCDMYGTPFATKLLHKACTLKIDFLQSIFINRLGKSIFEAWKIEFQIHWKIKYLIDWKIDF